MNLKEVILFLNGEKLEEGKHYAIIDGIRIELNSNFILNEKDELTIRPIYYIEANKFNKFLEQIKRKIEIICGVRQ